MSISSLFTRTRCCILLAAGWHFAARAQAPCDSLDEVAFTYQENGSYTYSFNPVTPVSGASILYTEWGFAGEDLMDFSLYPQPQFTFPGMGNYLVCLRATVQSDLAGICQTMHCELVPVPVDSACAGLVAGFNISVQGGSIQFADQTSPGSPVDSWTWDFGDGSGSSENAPTHVYSGTGPYQACLTVTSGGCSATACNWIYLGPATVSCDTLLQPAIGVIQYEKTIAVFDQSITSGMNSSITWDFGDGTTAEGSPVLHTYTDEGYYQVCGSVDLWGPLTPDTCNSSACSIVGTYVAAGIGSRNGREVLRAYPNPFNSTLTVEGTPQGARWEILDMLGRQRTSGVMSGSGPLVLNGKGIEAGTYLLRMVSSAGVQVVRISKSSSDTN